MNFFNKIFIKCSFFKDIIHEILKLELLKDKRNSGKQIEEKVIL
jgi:hypothetical protein